MFANALFCILLDTYVLPVDKMVVYFSHLRMCHAGYYGNTPLNSHHVVLYLIWFMSILSELGI